MKQKAKREKMSYGIVGLGRFGYALATELAQSGAEIIVIDRDEEKIRELREYTENAYVVKKLDKNVLTDTGIQNCDVAVVCVGEQMDTSILTVLNLVSMGIPKVIAKAASAEHGLILEKLGAEVVFPEKERAERLALSFLYSDVLERIDLRGDLVIEELRVPRRMVGKSLRGCGIRQKYGLNVIAIIADGGTVADLTPDTLFEDSSSLVVIGKRDAFTRFERDMFDD